MKSSWDEERRNYRRGQNRPIWIVDLKSYDLVSPPWTDSKDMDPVWVGDSVYFLSDRDGVSNAWAYDTKTKKLTQVTKYTDFHDQSPLAASCEVCHARRKRRRSKLLGIASPSSDSMKDGATSAIISTSRTCTAQTAQR